ncbi:MAG: PadR family transcriptional regulator, partial [Clostridiales bacterium]|nr:PadR family transcriptional regulator [Clostridiales bacterium]
MIYPLSPPLLEMLILSIIEKGDSYGYLISQQLKEVSNLKDSALYPVLKRLSENGYVEVYDQQFQGRNRKYYRITQAGVLQYEMLR